MEGYSIVDIYWFRPTLHESMGPVSQDGGLPLDGIARVLGGDQWADLSKTHLLGDVE